MSARVAQQTPEFLDLMKAFHSASKSHDAGVIAQAMCHWCKIPGFERGHIISILKNNLGVDFLTADERDAVLVLGGKEWLLSR